MIFTKRNVVLMLEEKFLDKIHELHFEKKFYQRKVGNTTLLVMNVIGCLQVCENVTIPVFIISTSKSYFINMLCELINKHVGEFEANNTEIIVKDGKNNRVRIFSHYQLKDSFRSLCGKNISPILIDQDFHSRCEEEDCRNLNFLSRLTQSQIII